MSSAVLPRAYNSSRSDLAPAETCHSRHLAEVPRDLVNLVVPQRGGLVATGERQEPFRLVDGGGLVVAAAAEFFCDLQAAGRPDSTRLVGLAAARAWARQALDHCQ